LDDNQLVLNFLAV